LPQYYDHPILNAQKASSKESAHNSLLMQPGWVATSGVQPYAGGVSPDGFTPPEIE